MGDRFTFKPKIENNKLTLIGEALNGGKISFSDIDIISVCPKTHQI